MESRRRRLQWGGSGLPKGGGEKRRWGLCRGWVTVRKRAFWRICIIESERLVHSRSGKASAGRKRPGQSQPQLALPAKPNAETANHSSTWTPTKSSSISPTVPSLPLEKSWWRDWWRRSSTTEVFSPYSQPSETDWGINCTTRLWNIAPVIRAATSMIWRISRSNSNAKIENSPSIRRSSTIFISIDRRSTTMKIWSMKNHVCCWLTSCQR